MQTRILYAVLHFCVTCRFAICIKT